MAGKTNYPILHQHVALTVLMQNRVVFLRAAGARLIQLLLRVIRLR